MLVRREKKSGHCLRNFFDRFYTAHATLEHCLGRWYKTGKLSLSRQEFLKLLEGDEYESCLYINIDLSLYYPGWIASMHNWIWVSARASWPLRCWYFSRSLRDLVLCVVVGVRQMGLRWKSCEKMMRLKRLKRGFMKACQSRLRVLSFNGYSICPRRAHD